MIWDTQILIYQYCFNYQNTVPDWPGSLSDPNNQAEVAKYSSLEKDMSKEKQETQESTMPASWRLLLKQTSLS